MGQNENGGDPLKLYQYLTRKKPVITTSILGASEFKEYIKITNSIDDWDEYICNPPTQKIYAEVDGFTWESRIAPVMEVIANA